GRRGCSPGERWRACSAVTGGRVGATGRPVRAGASHRRRVGMSSQGWQAEGACRGWDPDLWFPEKHERDERGRERLVVDVIALDRCAVCPVAEPCLTYAVEHDVEGVWAGTTPAQRRELRRLHGLQVGPSVVAGRRRGRGRDRTGDAA